MSLSSRFTRALAAALLGLTPLGAYCWAAPPADKPAEKAADAKEQEAKIKENLAKLSDDDRKLAEAQKWCAIETDDLLGSMGVPIKVIVKEQPVFLCCNKCTKQAQADPDKTLATVKELKAKAAKKADK